MPIAHNLNKVSKNVSKATGSIHIKGRKFKQLNRATLRDKKITSKKAESLEKKQRDMLLFKFVQEVLNTEFKDKSQFTLDDMKLLIESFLARFDDELEEMKKDKRPGRPVSTKQKILQEKINHDKQLYQTGIRFPDISDPHTVERIRLWNGSSGGTTVMKFVFISKSMAQLPVKEVSMKE
ncbi:uncharacterized protein KQ657_002858 [Scheffersomyces spartinae]|uniref:Translation machinery-associated protein 16 n=1 Tax=Scheffersomyces spartinae TaxID=45513 RepID=A0A9P7V5F7_9ASCO|nr:uncharacterized protein KQ657_002858 [Scheffersomyces spartinae]KAG7191722.1 hypothetical protein KQ657_002858 [Scheffersomyces spartinae]